MTTAVDREAWERHAQTFERDYWATAHQRHPVGWADCSRDPAEVHQRFRVVSRKIWRNFGFHPPDNAKCLDIGPGPLGRCSALSGTWDAIEPLANEYRQLPWVYLPYDNVYAVPAETPLPVCRGVYDVIVTLNCLDHCYDAAAVLTNIASYLKPGGTAFVSCDVDKGVDDDPTHPLTMTREETTDTIERAGFTIMRQWQGKCYPNRDGTWRDNWGGGTACHWILETRC